MTRIIKCFSALIATLGLLITAGSAVVLAIAQDWGSFTAAYIGMALIVAGAFVFKAADRREAL